MKRGAPIHLGDNTAKTVALITDLEQYEYVVSSLFFWALLKVRNVPVRGIVLHGKRRGMVAKIRAAAKRGATTIAIVGDELIGNLMVTSSSGDRSVASMKQLLAILNELPPETHVVAYGDNNCAVLAPMALYGKEGIRRMENSECGRLKRALRDRIVYYPPTGASLCPQKMHAMDAICKSFGLVRPGDYARDICADSASGLHVFRRCPKTILAARKEIEVFVERKKGRTFRQSDYFRFVDVILRLNDRFPMFFTERKESLDAKCREVLYGKGE